MAKTASTAVAEREETGLDASYADLEAELIAQNQEDVDSSDFQIPLLKVGQPLTDEVSSGDASPGEFINALTREGIGTEITFVVAGYQKGRFFHGDRETGRKARKAYGTANVPWPEDPHYGEPFAEHPDAEEQYSKRVNAGEIPWGKGPKISTTYDFTGFVTSGLEEDEDPIPVCLSLMRTNTRAAKKWATLLQAVLRNRYWDKTFELSTKRVTGNGNTYFVVDVSLGRKTTQDEKVKALALAKMLRNQSVQVVGDSDEESGPKAEPDAAGGMEV